MSSKNLGLHGNAPDRSRAAFLLIDLINDLDFSESDALLRFALPMAKRVARTKQLANEVGIPSIYVNDNFGRWQSNFHAQVEHSLRPESKGRPVVELLKPAPNDYFVLKPKHSGFFSTTLELLLEHLGVETLILSGLAGNICVLFTANDAYQRDFRLVVPCDLVASNTVEENSHALNQMAKLLKADTRESKALDLRKLAQGE